MRYNAPMLFLLIACNGDKPATTEKPAECATAPEVTYENWGKGFFLTWCGACHSSTSAERSGAPEGVDFDSLSKIQEWQDRIEARVLEEQSMPLGGGVYEEDLQLLEVFLKCGL
jgi:uncharacterized membrane protein